MTNLPMRAENTLLPTFFMDYEDPSIPAFVTANCSDHKSKEEKAIELYYAVRDLIRYDPYSYSFDKETFKASSVIETGRAWCVPKSILYTTCLRAIGVPALLGFADVRNHLSTERMRQTMKTDIFIWHGYTALFLYGKWVKATPAFNIELCEKFGLKSLNFNGRQDSIYHSFDLSGNKHMEYLEDHGTYEKFPFETMVAECKQFYGHQEKTTANFEEDVEMEVRKSNKVLRVNEKSFL